MKINELRNQLIEQKNTILKVKEIERVELENHLLKKEEEENKNKKSKDNNFDEIFKEECEKYNPKR